MIAEGPVTFPWLLGNDSRGIHERQIQFTYTAEKHSRFGRRRFIDTFKCDRVRESEWEGNSIIRIMDKSIAQIPLCVRWFENVISFSEASQLLSYDSRWMLLCIPKKKKRWLKLELRLFLLEMLLFLLNYTDKSFLLDYFRHT